MQYGTNFQLPQEPSPAPFITPFSHLLKLSTNTPPVTRFNIPNSHSHTYRIFKRLLSRLKRQIKQHECSLLTADKGPGLVIIENNTLTGLYNAYIQSKATLVHPADYLVAFDNLFTALLQIDPFMKTNTTDSRPPTFYFKVKTHKPAFITSTTPHPEIYIYNQTPSTLLPIVRPILNHKASISCLCANFLRPLLTPIINASPFLTSDIYQTINNLCQHGPPPSLYTGDIEQFYPSTPHNLIKDAFTHYYPTFKQELKLLTKLLDYNFITEGKSIYHLGDLGIPMGLTLAPELARMATAYLLKDYHPPPGETLTLYFDDATATYPINDLPLSPYNLKLTTPNETQDAIYNPTTHTFSPTIQPYRQPVPLHPHSYHPSTKLVQKAYLGSASRASQIGTKPSETLNHLIRKYLPPLQRSGHDYQSTIINLTNAVYFPKIRQPNPPPRLPIIKYQFSHTRPTIKQLTPLIKEPFLLIPTTGLSPLKSQITYHPPYTNPVHSVYPCPTYQCNLCTSYDPLINTSLPTPVIPCSRYRCLYLLHYPTRHRLHFYLASTNLHPSCLCDTKSFNRIAKHIRPKISWQILYIYPPHFCAPHNDITQKQRDWAKKLTKLYPDSILYHNATLANFYDHTNVP